MHSLMKNRLLFERILEFNLSPQNYIHSTWLNLFIPENRDFDWRNCPRSAERISMALLRKIGNTYDFKFNQLLKRVALLYYEELIELSDYIGLAIASKVIRQMIEKKYYEKLRNELGNAKMKFALERAHLLTHGTLHAVAVDDFHQNPRKFSRKVGIHCIHKHINEYSEAVVRRFRYKLPKEIEFDMSDDPLTEAGSGETTVNLILRILKTEMNVLWNNLFI